MEKLQNRRKFIKTTGLILVSAILPSVGCDSNKVTFSQMPTGPADVPDEMPDEVLPPAPITSNSRFYLQSIKGQAYDPKLKSEEWSLDVVGLVDNPIQGMTYADIPALPLERQAVTLQCIGNWIGGPLIGHAEWGGAPLSTLLERAGVQAEATRVKFDSIDGYSTAISMDIALRPETFLVWKMNGHRLPSRHGYPLRLVNPGHYGQKMPKWITRIELIDEDFLGYWESKPEGKPWGPARPMVVPPVAGYSIYYHKLTIAPDSSLWLSYSYYTADVGYQSQFPELYNNRAVIVSKDRGKTWKLAESKDFPGGEK